MNCVVNRPRRPPLAAVVFGLAVAFPLIATAPARADDPPADDGAEAPPGDQPADVPVAVDGDAYADTDPSALTDFQPTLEPHGAWADDPNYGTVWTPNPDEVGADFTPYVSAGHWAYDDDYTWVSDYDWGWATFHYGRWVWLRSRGWAWIPGRLYSSAWVVWRVGADDMAFIGWAPLAPSWGWRGGVAGALGFATPEPYVFCPPRAVFTPVLGPQLAPASQTGLLVAQTRPYVRAIPVVGPPLGANSARALTRGPAPSLLGLDASRVPHLGRSDVAIDRARRFARPSTAVALGARPATPHVFRAVPVPRPVVYARPPARQSGPQPGPARNRR